MKTDEPKPRYSYRAFICYAHDDGEIAISVVQAIEKAGLVGLLDKKISGGVDYFNEIRDFIQSAHLFVPIITEGALHQPWVNQEIGFAHALNVPVLPICIGVAPKGLIQNLNAVSAKAVSDLPAMLESIDFEKIVRTAAAAQRMLVEIAPTAIDRPRLMTQSAEKILGESLVYGGGMVRQRAYYTSFSLPDEAINQPIWAEREYGQPRSPDYLREQRRERQVMEKLARKYGCRLIIDPRPGRFPGAEIGWRARLKVLRDFLASPVVEYIEAMSAELPEPHNLVLVGDRFLAEADSRLAGQGYLRTQFTWHAPTVLDRVRRFDEEFTDLCRAKGIRPKDSRRHTLHVLKDLLASTEAITH